MDTMTATKIVGSLCGALLIFLLGGWAAESIYHTSVEDHDGEPQQAYTIEVEDGGEAAEDVAAVPFEEVFAVASAEEGAGIWRQCSSCHKFEDGANGTGPHLYEVVGRAKHAVADYAYSSSFMELAGDWTPEDLNGFLENPQGYVPGTKMTYRGLSDVEDRANLIAYLATGGV